MPRYQQIRIGDSVEYDDIECVVEAVVFETDQPAALRLRAVDGTLYRVSASALAQSVVAARHDDDGPPAVQPLQLDGIDDTAKAEAIELLGHMREIETGYRSGMPDPDRPDEPRPAYDLATTTVTSRIDSKAQELGISNRQLFTLWSRYSEAGVFGLVDKRKIKKSNPLANVDPRLVDAIKTMARLETNDSTGTYRRLKRRVERHLNETYGAGEVPVPTAPTFNRYVKEVLAGRHTLGNATTRRTTAAQPDHSFALIAATRPGEVVMIDTTRLDAFAFDPDTGSAYAVELTFMLDLYTRSLLAFRLTPVGTKSVDAALMLADALTPETMRPGWPESVRYRVLQIPYERMVSVDDRIAEAAARPIILPEVIIIDHGKVFVSQAFRGACTTLGISVQLARKGQGTDKANVERLFNTVRTQFSEHLAGYKGPNVSKRGADPESRALWTIGELEEFLTEYVVRIYQRQTHRGLTLPGWPELRMSPNDAYNEAVTRTGVIAVPPNPQLYFELLPTVWCTIRHDGVRVNGLSYRSKELFRYKHMDSGVKAENGKWPIKYDPRDRNQVFFQDPGDGSWSAAPWIHRYDDTQPFTDRTVDFVKRTLAERNGRAGTEFEIAEELVALQNRMDTPAALIPKERARAVRDAERGRVAARDRAAGGMPDPPLHVVPDPVRKSDADDDFELGDLNGFGIYDPHKGRLG
jgi:transposase InsO family protein